MPTDLHAIFEQAAREKGYAILTERDGDKYHDQNTNNLWAGFCLAMEKEARDAE